MKTVSELNAAWERIGVRVSGLFETTSYLGQPINPRDRLTRSAVPGCPIVGVTMFDRQRESWARLFRLLLSLPQDYDVRSILVTAMSIGADVRDGARIADTMGVYDRHPNLTFYGHDISPMFTDVAARGFIPEIFTTYVPEREKYFIKQPMPFDEYVRFRSDLEDRIQFLEPSCITELAGRFDVVVSHIMNPAPLDINEALRARARHMAIRTEWLRGVSQAWQPYCNEYEIGWGPAWVHGLPGNSVPQDIPEALILDKFNQ